MFSRLAATRNVFRQLKNVPKNQIVLQRASHDLRYRSAAPPNKRQLIISELVLGIMWGWILWHMWFEPELITGEWPDIDPSKWTDEDLGIPPDDVGPAPKINQ